MNIIGTYFRKEDLTIMLGRGGEKDIGFVITSEKFTYIW